jgi:putative ABC transport system permease protein
MLQWIFKSIRLQKTNFIASAAGLGAALFLIIAFKAFLLGEMSRTINYPRIMDPDLWVMQKGVSNMHMARSEVWSWKARRVASVPGVQAVTPILYSGVMIRAQGGSSLAYAVGLAPDGARAGPGKMHSGKALPDPGEIILPAVFRQVIGVELGDSVTIANHTFRVAGFSEENFSMANSIVFLAYSDLQDLLNSIGSYSYLLVDVEPGRDANAVAREIERVLGKITVLTQEEFLRNDFEMIGMMGIEMVVMMSYIGSALAFLIVGFTAFTQALRQKRELAIIKALGFPSRSIYLAAFLHILLVTGAGILAAFLLAFVTAPSVTALVPQVKMMLAPDILWETALYAVIVALAASIFPAYVVSRVEPVLAFRV